MVTFPEYESFDGLGLANLVRQGVISPLELLDAAIERIEQRNSNINAVIHKMYDQARALAKKEIPSGLFQGVPFLLKDLLANYAGESLRSGSRFTQSYVSSHDSELVKRFKQAGLLILGKTNTPELGLSFTTEPELFGPTHNPWNLEKSAGGSSGGSAAAVASGMVPMAHGGDGSGSIRIPAAFCGVFGLKPSRGRTPAGPDMMQIWQGMVVEHVLTYTVRDSAAMLDVLAGPEVGSPIALPKPTESFLNCLEKKVGKLRMAMIPRPFFSAKVDPDYLDFLKKAATLCQELGHEVEEVSLDINGSEIALALLIVIAADTAASVKWLAKAMQCKAEYHQLEIATAVICEVGEHFSAKDFAWATYILDRVGKQLAEFFLNYQIIITPTMAAPAPVLGRFKLDWYEKNGLEILRRIPMGPLLRKLAIQKSEKYLAFAPFTPLFNMGGQPAMSVPLFFDRHGMPVGIQFAGRFGDEKTLLQLAHQLEEVKPFTRKI